MHALQMHPIVKTKMQCNHVPIKQHIKAKSIVIAVYGVDYPLQPIEKYIVKIQLKSVCACAVWFTLAPAWLLSELSP